MLVPVTGLAEQEQEKFEIVGEEAISIIHVARAMLARGKYHSLLIASSTKVLRHDQDKSWR